jgi:DNA/RNA-binding domain of Phe-tRNA-synthetase-like protein
MENRYVGTVSMNRLESLPDAAQPATANISDLEVSVQLADVEIGIVEIDRIEQTVAAPELTEQIDETCHRLRRQYSRDSLREWEPIQKVRSIFRGLGLDPSRHRPSSEALLRRIVNGDALPRVSTVVDIGNLGAIEMGWPYGCYNRQKISGSIEVRLGKPGEQYDGIGRQVLRLEGRPVFSDDHGPFGSPVSDSTRTMVTESTQELLFIICAPESGCASTLEEALFRLAQRLSLWCGASGIRKKIVRG